MPLVTTTEMFKKAYDGGYAIGAFNVNNMEIVQGITEAAAELNAPLILQVSKGARKYANHTYLMKLVEAAIIETGLPIALHLDHGDSFELCKSCIDGGFSSVMIDASSKPFEENIALTKQVVEYAHDHGVVVEAELGTLAGIEDEVKVSHEDSSYTRPEDVQEFVERTGCDSLAIAIGNAHGNYIATPNLSFERLRELRAALDLPLVLHGGSGIPDDQFGRCALEGMSKFNIFTEYNMALSNAMKASLDKGNKGGLQVLCDCKDACKELVKHKINMVNPKGLRVI